jgi:antitoxin ParD1/3/4
MAILVLPDEIQTVLEAGARDGGFADATEYVTDLIRQDQKRRAHKELEALVLEGVDSGDPVDMTAQAWRELRLDLHRQAGLD